MAAGLDFGLLNFLLPIFSFLFILFLLYGILSKTKILGENKNVNIVASLSIAFIVLLSGNIIKLINFFTPWFVLIFVFLFLLFAVLMFLGKKEEDIFPIFGGANVVFLVLLFILIIGIGTVFSGTFTPAGGNGDVGTGGILGALVHPRVLGAILILVIAAFSVQRITDNI